MGKSIDPTEPDGTAWETLVVGLGDEWDFKADGPLVGTYVNTITDFKTVGTDPQTGAKVERITQVHQFMPEGSDRIAFLWGSQVLDEAMAKDLIRPGVRMRIEFLGKDTFTGNKGPQTIRRYAFKVDKRSIAQAPQSVKDDALAPPSTPEG